MRVREDSGDTETDIGFDSNGDLDTAAIATHCGSANGYVVTWYDQAGSNNATQSTAGNQPQIYNGTAVITENGKPAVDFDGSNSHHFVSSSNITQTGPRAEFVVTSFESTLLTDIGFLIDQDSNVTADRVCQNIRIKDGELQSINIQGGIVNVTGSTTLTANNQYLLSTEQTATALSVYVDGSQDGTASSTGSAGSQPITIGKPQRTIGPLGRYYGKMQEIVMYTSNQSSNRTGIETNINGYFSIY